MKLSWHTFVCKHSIPVLLFSFFFHFYSFAQVQTQKPVTIKLHNNVGGYLESLPVGYDANPQKKYPLIIFFHGIGEVGNGSAASLEKVAANGIPKLIKQGKFPASFRSGGQDYSFIVISPQYVSSTGHEAYVGEVIKHCLQKYRVDEERIYLTGLSMGGGVTYGYSSSSNAAAGQLAAALYVCPAASVNTNRSKLLAASGLPVWATHSRGDAVVKSSISVNLVNGINAFNPKPAAKLTIFESNSHDAWSKTYDINYRENGLNIYEWMLQYKRGKVAPPPPVANAGMAQTVTLPVNYVMLDGSKSSAKGRIVAYAWTKVSGPAGGNISSPGNATTNVTGLAVGNYEFQLKVTDENGMEATSGVVITVKPALLPPVANAGSTQVITLPVSSVMLNGSASSAPSGVISRYEWIVLSGPAAPYLETPGAAQTNVTLLQEGTYVFQLKVTDNNGKSSTASVTITVNAAPLPPRADAGNDITIQLPVNNITLDASASKAGSGAIQRFYWTKISGPLAGSISDEAAAVTVVDGLEEGTYEFQLEVTDEHGLKATSVVVVTVAAPATPPVAEAGQDVAMTLPESSVTLDGSQSTAKGMITAWHWTKISGPGGPEIESPDSPVTVVSKLAGGTYKFELKVTDNNGLSSTDIVTVDVKEPVLPTADAGEDITIQLPEAVVTLDGSRSLALSGNIVEHNWKEISGKDVVFSSNISAITEVTGLQEGRYYFELTVVTSEGASASDTLVVTVKAAAIKPVPDAGEDMVVILPENSITLDGSKSIIPEGASVTYNWKKIQGEDASVEDPASAVTQVSDLVEGTYIFELTLGTEEGVVESDRVIVTVKPAIIYPVAITGNDTVITLPENTVILDGSKSIIPPGPDVVYGWTSLDDNAVMFTNQDQLTATISGLPEGVYRFVLNITDGIVSVSDTMTVAVKAAPVAPVAIVTIPAITVTLPENETLLDGSGSTGNIQQYQWTKISGPESVVIENAETSSATVKNLSEGTYTYELVVTDMNGLHSNAVVVVTVKPAPLPPVANAGSAVTITLPVSDVPLDGSRSTGGSAAITGYQWTKLSGPEEGRIINADKVQATAEGLSEGEYVFLLEVSNALHQRSSAKVNVTVKVIPPPPVAVTGNDITIVLPVDEVNLNGNKSQAPGGRIVSYLWEKMSGPAGGNIMAASAAETKVTGLSAGTYEFRLTVTDNNGATVAASVAVVVKPQPAPPVADAGISQNITLPVNAITLDGSRSSAPGKIVSYTWAKTAGLEAGSITASTNAVTTVTGLVAGTYEFQLTVVDDNNNSAVASVSVTVKPAPVRPPVANAGADFTIQLPDGTVELNGSGSYALDGTITTYSWTKMSGPGAVTVSGSHTAMPTVKFTAAGIYVIRLTVTDSNGSTSYTDLTVTVIAENIIPAPPVAQTGTDQVLTLPENETMLDASGSYTTVGNITKYEWVLVSGNPSAVITDPNMDITRVTHLIEGEYVLEVTVTDSRGMTAKDTMRITVNNAGGRPDNTLDVKIYPNSVQSVATIELSGLVKGRTMVDIYNLTGKKMKHQEFLKGDIFTQDRIDFSSLPKGIYFVEVIVDFQHRKVLQVVKF